MAVGIVNKSELVFNIHKEDIVEDTLKYKRDLTKKYGLSDNDAHDLFVRIVNYQIDKYGCQKQKFYQFLNKDDYEIKHRRHKQRQYMRTKE